MLICGTEIEYSGQLLRTARLAADGYDFIDNPKPLVEQLRQAGPRIDLFTFTQGLKDPVPRHDYPIEWDNFAALPVSTFDYWWNNQIRSYPRNRARQAEKKGVILREVPFSDALVGGIWGVYNECPVRQGRRFRHYGKDIETVYKEEATFLDSSSFIGAFLNEELIGFVKLMWDRTGTQANLMNIVSMMRYRDKAPTNALIARSVQFCAERHIKFLVYQSFSYGNKKPDSISHFKEINGFQRINIPRYYVPLTKLGSAALRLGLHRRILDRFPEALVGRVREVRNMLYNRRLKSIEEMQ
ncbi:MAG: hypothetical protein WBE38_03765 [Terracidiphilus sp.]